jgi:hypothetical protein
MSRTKPSFRLVSIKIASSKTWKIQARREGREKDDDKRLLNRIERETDINIEYDRNNLITLKISIYFLCDYGSLKKSNILRSVWKSTRTF